MINIDTYYNLIYEHNLKVESTRFFRWGKILDYYKIGIHYKQHIYVYLGLAILIICSVGLLNLGFIRDIALWLNIEAALFTFIIVFLPIMLLILYLIIKKFFNEKLIIKLNSDQNKIAQILIENRFLPSNNSNIIIDSDSSDILIIENKYLLNNNYCIVIYDKNNPTLHFAFTSFGSDIATSLLNDKGYSQVLTMDTPFVKTMRLNKVYRFTYNSVLERFLKYWLNP